jgi:hypothetical protein
MMITDIIRPRGAMASRILLVVFSFLLGASYAYSQQLQPDQLSPTVVTEDEATTFTLLQTLNGGIQFGSFSPTLDGQVGWSGAEFYFREGGVNKTLGTLDGSVGGDLDGTTSNATVTGLNGVPIDTSVVLEDQMILEYSISLNKWVPGNTFSGNMLNTTAKYLHSTSSTYDAVLILDDDGLEVSMADGTLPVTLSNGYVRVSDSYRLEGTTSDPAVSDAGDAKLIYNTTDGALKVSLNGDGYVPVRGIDVKSGGTTVSPTMTALDFGASDFVVTESVAGRASVVLVEKPPPAPNVIQLGLTKVPLEARAPAPEAVVLNGASNNVSVTAYAYDDSIEEFAVFDIHLPAQLDTSGRVTITLTWLAATPAANEVVWKTYYSGIASNESFDQVLSSKTVVSTASSVTDTVTQTSISDDITGFPFEAGDHVVLHVSRDAADGSDTLSGDAYLISASLAYDVTGEGGGGGGGSGLYNSMDAVYIDTNVINIQAEYLTLRNSAGATLTLPTVNVTPDISASVGINGPDQAGLDTANSWRAYYVIAANLNTVAGLIGDDSQVPVLPDGYPFYQLLGWIRNDPSADLRSFQKQDKLVNYFQPGAATGDPLLLIDGGNSNSFVDVDCSGLMPPTSRRAKFLMRIFENSGETYLALQIRKNGEDLDYGNGPMYHMILGSGQARRVQDVDWSFTDSNRVVEYYVDTANGPGNPVARIGLVGYMDKY